MKKIAVLTGLFGNFTKVHFTDCENAYVVTTKKNKKETDLIKSQGWNVYFVNENESKSLVEGSRKSKLVKTLKYLKPEARYILYVDHKWVIMKEHIQKLIELVKGYPILAFKNNADVYKEFYNSMCFKRYSVDMKKILRTVQQYEGESVEMFLTGLILYDTTHKDFDKIIKSLNNSLEKHKHLQCQITFPFALKDFEKNLIHNNINLNHRYPEPAQEGITF